MKLMTSRPLVRKPASFNVIGALYSKAMGLPIAFVLSGL